MLSDKTEVPSAPQESETPKVPLRMDKVHGGETVELVETPIRITPANHEHKFVLDPTETDFIAYMCTDAKCGAVRIYDK